MSGPARRQLGQWAARYRALAVVLAALVAVVVAFPSVPPDLAGFSGAASPEPAAPTTSISGAPPVPVAGPGTAPPAGLAPAAPAASEGPAGGSPGALAAPPDVPTDTVPCPVDLPEVAGSTPPLPLADVLNIASPVLPLLGPFVPFALAGLPTVGPVLPVVTPLLPLGQPVFVFLGPLAARTVGPLAEYEAILLQPIAAPIEAFTPEALAAQQAFLAQLQPVIDRVNATGLPTCGAVLVGSLAGVLQQTIVDLGIGRLVDEVLGLLDELT